jgi:hypothetical protein
MQTNTKRYITRGVNEEVSLNIQILLWNLIESTSYEVELDYLQVFELKVINSNGITAQKIIHKQEVPYYQKEYTLNIDNPVNAKLYVIDSIDYVTMMLAEEY